jgi:hypothetical protein
LGNLALERYRLPGVKSMSLQRQLQVWDEELRFGNLALEAPRHEVITFIRRVYEKNQGLGQRAQIEKSSSSALEAPRHEINAIIKTIGKDLLGFEQETQIWKAVPMHAINIVIRTICEKLIGAVQKLTSGNIALEL